MTKEQRIKKYLAEMQAEYKAMQESYARFLSYNAKLTEDLLEDMTSADKQQLIQIHHKFKNRFVLRMASRIIQDDWDNLRMLDVSNTK